MTFILDERLAAETVEICQLDLSFVGLMRDERYPWLVVVPRKPGLVEVTDLGAAECGLLWREVERCCRVLQTSYPNTKLNIGALGNIVRQLHIHVIARYEGDAAWPGPVWGVGEAVSYGDVELAEIRDKLKRAF